MAGKGWMGLRIGSWTAIWVGLLGYSGAPAAFAAECPGHPDAIGTSRTIVVDPREHPRIGTMQYPETLPLRDHEVVLTFDDGPLPRNSYKVLQILADNCVKATFFLIGQQARANPEGVRKLVAAGHTIGTHSQNHPLTFEKMSNERVQQEVDGGIASVTAALTDPSALAPFFRVPGLLRAKNVEDYLASKDIQVWSADFDADDWRHISPERVYDLAIKRLEATHKGILLLHDIHARTVAALPKILNELKVRGYHIVQVVPATPDRPATPTEPKEWRMHPAPDLAPVAAQPTLPTFVFAEAERLVTPAPADFSTPDGKSLLTAEPFDRVKPPVQSASAPSTSWPSPITQPAQSAAVMLPAPSESLFELPEQTRAVLPLAAFARASSATITKPHASARRTSFRAVGLKPTYRMHARLPRNIQTRPRTVAGGPSETKQRMRVEKSAPRRALTVASLKKHPAER